MSEIKKKKGVWYSVILIVLIVFGTIVLVDISSEKFSLFRSAETGAVVRESTLPGYNYEISDGEYSAYFKNAISKEGYVKYVRNGSEVSFQPVEMRYVSDSRYLQPISSAKDAPAIIGDDTITFENVFNGVDFIYEYSPDTLKERIILKDASTFFTPHSSILANNPALELQFIFSFKNSDLAIEGEKWDKSSAKKTKQSLDFRNFRLEPVFLRDADGKVTELEYGVKRSGKSFFVTTRVPYSVIRDGAFPLEIDPSITATQEQETLGPIAEAGEGDILAPPAPTDAIYTRFSMKRCSGSSCNEQIFMNPIAMKNEQGEYRPFREVVKATTKDGLLKIEWKGKSITFAPYMVHGNKKYRERGTARLSFTPDLPQSISLTNRKKEHTFSYEYDLGFSNMQNYKSNLKEVGLEIVDTGGSSKDDIKVTPEGIILPDDGEDSISFPWRDAIGEGYRIQTSKDKILASNVAGMVSFIIDPTLAMSANEDVYTYCSSPCVIPGGGLHHTYLQFNLTSIPSGATITNAELILNATAIVGGGVIAVAYNCTGDWTEASSFATITGLVCSNTGNSTNVASEGYKFWNLTLAVKGMYDSGAKNITFRLNSTYLGTSDAIQSTTTELRVGNSSDAAAGGGGD